jgi:hypothetical protein
MANEKNEPPVDRDLEAAPHAPSGLGNGNGNEDGGLSEKDEAIAIVGEQQNTVDPAVVARAVRKIDWFLIPAMIFGCETRHSSMIINDVLR